jgi:hypothetical protein
MFTQATWYEYCISLLPGLQVRRTQPTGMAFAGSYVENIKYIHVTQNMN